MNKKVIVVLILLMSVRVNMQLVMGEQSSYSRGVGVEIVEDFEPINPAPEGGIVEVEREEEKQENEKPSKREEGSSVVLSNRLPWTGKELEWMMVILLLVTAIVSYKVSEKRKNKYRGEINNV